MGIVVSLMISICLLAILYAQYKGLKGYKRLMGEAVVASQVNESILERTIYRIGTGIILAVIVIICVQGVLNRFNQRILLWVIAGYLFTYYASEYVSHCDWVMMKDGIRYSRQLEPIGWENVIRYRWYKQGEQDVLRVSFKGKGLVTRKCDLCVPKQKIRYVKQLLEKQVPWIKA